jgi:branched-chain amino acid transport system ATP-binding protein
MRAPDDITAISDQGATLGPALQVENLSKRFGGLNAVQNVSFSIEQNSLTAVIGPNGAGKTTLFNLVTGIYPPDDGEVKFFGARINGLSPFEIAEAGLVRTFQSARVFPGMTVLENVLSGAHLTVRSGLFQQMLWLPKARRDERALVARAGTLLDIVGLGRFRDTRATDLPMGAQKLLELVRALMARPRVLLLDEPAAGLNDSETAELATMLKAVQRSGVTIILVEHNMPLVMGIADRVVVIDAGRIVTSGSPAEIQRDSRVIAAYVGELEDNR